jgi:hypothetical protein
MNKRQFIGPMLSLILIICLTFSFAYVSSHAIHNCSGESCSICAHISAAENFSNNLSNTTAIVPFLFLLCLSFLAITFLDSKYLPNHTLVSLKVKLSN